MLKTENFGLSSLIWEASEIIQMNSPFFSVIIPTFNSAQSIVRAVNSVLIQSFFNYEIVVVDGRSTDETLKILTDFNDSRIHIYVQTDLGPYDAMNCGIDKSRGRWIYFLGSDDELYDSTILSKLQWRLRNPFINVAYGNVLISGSVPWAKEALVYDGKFSFYKLLRRNICHQGIFYRRSFLNKHKLRYFLNYPISADWDLNIRSRLKTGFYFIDLVIARFNSGGISSSANADDGYASQIPLLFSSYWEVPYVGVVKRLLYRLKVRIIR